MPVVILQVQFRKKIYIMGFDDSQTLGTMIAILYKDLGKPNISEITYYRSKQKHNECVTNDLSDIIEIIDPEDQITSVLYMNDLNRIINDSGLQNGDMILVNEIGRIIDQPKFIINKKIT